MAKIKGAIVVDIERCKGCEVCVGACPTNVIGMHEQVNGKGYHYAYMANADWMYRLCKLCHSLPGRCYHRL